MKTEKLFIDGMSCKHCVMTLKKQLSRLDLKIKDVQIGSAEVEYNEEKISHTQLEEAVNEAGYVLKN